MKKQLTWVALGTLTCVAVYWGFWHTTRSWQEAEYFLDPAQERGLAAQSATHIKKHSKSAASVDNLSKGLSWVRTRPGYLGVRLKHPVLEVAGGQKAYACDVYTSISLEFLSEGVYVSGDPSKMTAKGPCKSTKDNQHIETLWLPLGEVFKKPRRDLANYVSAGEKTTVSLSNIGHTWPKSWVLSGVEFLRNPTPGPRKPTDTMSNAKPIRIGLKGLRNPQGLAPVFQYD